MASGLKIRSVRWAAATLFVLAAAGCSSSGGSSTEKHLPPRRISDTGQATTSATKYIHDTGKSLASSTTAKKVTSATRAMHDRGTTRGALLGDDIGSSKTIMGGAQRVQNTGKSLAAKAKSATPDQTKKAVAQANKFNPGW